VAVLIATPTAGHKRIRQNLAATDRSYALSVVTALLMVLPARAKSVSGCAIEYTAVEMFGICASSTTIR